MIGTGTPTKNNKIDRIDTSMELGSDDKPSIRDMAPDGPSPDGRGAGLSAAAAG